MRQEDVIAGQEGRIVDPTKAVPLGPQVSATVEINQGRVDSMSDVENNQSPVKPGLIQKWWNKGLLETVVFFVCVQVGRSNAWDALTAGISNKS